MLPFVTGVVTNTAFFSFEEHAVQALPGGEERGTSCIPPMAGGRCCFYFLQHGVLFQDTTEPLERVKPMGTRPAPWSGVIFLTRPGVLISGSGQLAASWRRSLAVRGVRGGSRRSVQLSVYTQGVGLTSGCKMLWTVCWTKALGQKRSGQVQLYCQGWKL